MLKYFFLLFFTVNLQAEIIPRLTGIQNETPTEARITGAGTLGAAFSSYYAGYAWLSQQGVPIVGAQMGGVMSGLMGGVPTFFVLGSSIAAYKSHVKGRPLRHTLSHAGGVLGSAATTATILSLLHAANTAPPYPTLLAGESAAFSGYIAGRVLGYGIGACIDFLKGLRSSK